MASKKSKILAIAFCAAVMSGIYVNPVFAERGDQDFNYQHNTTESGLNNPEIHHTVDNGYWDNNGTPLNPFDDEYVADWQPVHPEGDVNCEEEVVNSNITVGDMNKVTADLVANDEKINGKVDKVASDVKNLQEQVNNIETTADTDTHVKEGAATVDENGNVTMDIVDKDGKDTGKDVTISGLASDKELAAETQNRTDADTKLQEQINDNATAIATETQNRTDADTKLQEQINDNATAIATETQNRTDADTKLQANINAEAEAREKADADLQADINAKEEQSKYRDEQLQQSIDIQREVIGADSTEDLKGAYSGTNYISDAENMVEADRKLDAAISDVNSRVDGIENRVDGLEDRIDKVGAMSAAIANLRTMGYDPAAPTEVAVGVGQYRDETGMALGLFHYPNRDFMLSLSVSTSGDEYMGGIGATWKFGRKSPEKVAEIKKAQAEADARRAEEQKLAKAEEMKKAAKEAKVQAQMERHAKLAAERAALEEA